MQSLAQRNYVLRGAALALFLSACFPAAAQTRLNDQNLHGWYVYTGDHPLNDRWGAHLEGQWRRHDAGVRPQQLLLRPALNYRISERIALSAGYAYVGTSRYGSYPAQAAFPEHRLYQQVTVKQQAARLELQHRFRIEERWIGQTAPAAPWRYQNRFRYMLRAVVPMSPQWYGAVSNEIFLNLPPRNIASPYDQNRAFTGIGRKVNPYTRIEAGYLQQSLLQRNRRVLEWNHTILVGVYSVLPFGRLR